ncbi:MAG: hypothetical protein P4L98_02510 [Ancalomicrobiaceae bacterium]|nr:hypothetical protein [Ancalomicrobiaceae bacterium]
MSRFARVLLASGALFLGLQSAASAADGAAFLTDLAGPWTGSGYIRTNAADAPASTKCGLSGTASGNQVSIEGACDGAAMGAHMAVVLRWNAALGQVLGTFQGGSEVGTANLAGKIDGTALRMQVTSASGATSRLALSKSGRQLSITIAGNDRKTGKPVTWVQIALKKG